MNLRAQMLALVAPRGSKVSTLYHTLRSLGHERVDYALHGLIADGTLVRVGDVVARPAHTLSVACSRCHESRRRDELIQRGQMVICLRCASDAASPPAVTKTARTCPCCQQEWAVTAYGPGVYCPPCARVKRQEISAKARAKYRADRRTDPAFARVLAKLRQPDGAKYLSRGGRDETA